MASLLQRIGGEKVLEALLRDFYGKAREDDLLGPVFSRVVDDWEYHIQKVVIYWRRQTQGEPNYRQAFTLKHQPLLLKPPHFDRWLSLFKGACERHLSEKEAADVFDIAIKVAETLHLAVLDGKEPNFTVATTEGE